ncbi:hypothetical protein [Nesterenkonia pannonica]|uniref:2-oxo-4-hydroxy-4-carboxy-5-ureidoimidazoline decarboxylase n=1 Tax=Nesterenkonia pannonica TaxID=1548602 RepID=UPI0021640446|nr:2-oxo-4-hydroxy-4-carboxy-5-ureidoimidazoline decarboxylase [Nesterenkonia pannonica]
MRACRIVESGPAGPPTLRIVRRAEPHRRRPGRRLDGPGGGRRPGAPPRIGEKVSGDDAEAAASRREQGELTADEQARIDWIEANRQYEARFDRIFLIRAKGRSSEEMLEHLQRRLSHDAETENEVRRQQLAEIALLRLEESLRS